MAETKKNSEKKTTTKTTTKSTAQAKPAAKSNTQTKSTTNNSTKTSNTTVFGWGLNKISFYTIGAVCILYLIGLILAACGVNLKAVGVLQGLATAIMISIVAFLGWKYVKPKPTVWKVLYFVFLLVTLIGIIIPLVI